MVQGLILLGGLVGLWFGTRLIINGAFGIATHFNLSHSFVGVAILSVGTDLPEVFVSIEASLLHLKGIETSGIVTGNAIGSSLSQITFVLGVAGLLLHFKMMKEEIWRDGIFLLISILALIVFGFDGIITRFEGAVLLAVYFFYYLLIIKSQSGNTNNSENDSKEGQYSNITLALILATGFIVLIVSSHLVVESAMILAQKWGVAQSFIGIAIIGLGTSLPELAVSLGAAIRKSAGMSVGNIIGSNIFDGFVPVGLGGVISTTNMEISLLKFDLPVLLVATLLVILFLYTKRGISKVEGIVLILFYLLYMAIKLFYFEGIHLS